MDAHQHNPTPRENDVNHNQRHNKPKLRANINVATLNMNGLSAPASNTSYLERWTMINQTLNNKIVILAFQETHLDEESTDRIRTTYKKR